MAKVEEMKIDQLVPDDHNFNEGTEFGQHLMEKSFREFGAGRSILLDKNNRIISGNKSTETAADLGFEKVIVVETEGDTLVAVRRTDIDLDTERGRGMALADNVTAKENIKFNLPEIEDVTKDMDLNPADWGIDLGDIDLQLGNDEEPNDGEYGKLTDRFIVPPFSVLDTRQGYWQDRKRVWLEKTGNLSETRDGEFGTLGGTENMLAQINGGTSNFDPVLAEVIMSWFCPAGGKLLDPFGGEQTKGVVAGELGINYHAVEFRQEQVDLNREKTAQYKGVHYTCGDSNNITNLISERGFDLCFTSPPYYDLEVYSKDDMSALGSYDEFMGQYENIFRQCVDMLAEDAFLVVKICEIRDKKTGVYRNFVGDNISIFNKLGLHYYNELILVNACGTAPLRANKMMSSRKVVKVHQNILVFYKGNIERLCKKLPSLNFENS